MAIRAILFDLDGTLWHSPLALPDAVLDRRSAIRVAALLTAWGLPVDAAALSRALSDALARTMATAMSGPLISPIWIDLVEGVVQAANLDLDRGQRQALWTAWRLNGAERGRQPYPDALTTLRWARASGYRIGLISNCVDHREPFLAELTDHGFGGAFDAITLSSEAGWLKPHPMIFSAALDALGTDAAETLMVGDGRRADIGGAKRFGMPAVWKRNGRRDPLPPTLFQPDAVIDDLWELRRLPLLARGDDVAATTRPTA